MNPPSKEVLKFQLALKRREYLAALKNCHEAYEREPERHWFQSFLESQSVKVFAGPTGKLRIKQETYPVKGTDLVGRMVRWSPDLRGPTMDRLEAHIRTVESLYFVEIGEDYIEWPDITYHLKVLRFTQ